MLLTKPLLALRPNRSDWIFAIKTFCAGMLALYIALSLDLAYPIWAIGTVFVIANPYTGMTASKSMFRVLGTALGAIISIIFVPMLIHTPWLFTLFLAIWVGLCLYISLLDRTPRSYAFMLAGYTTVIISFTIINTLGTSTVFDIAIGRFIEISIGVLCSAVVMTSFAPMNIGPGIESQISKVIDDTQQIFDKILLGEIHFKHPDPAQHAQQQEIASPNYTQELNLLARDISNLHVMAIHLSYERSKLKDMTKPLQEMLHQLSILVANLVAMTERLNQLHENNHKFQHALNHIHKHTATFFKHADVEKNPDLNLLPDQFDHDFEQLARTVRPEQRIVVASLKMDVRHFIQNIRAIHLIWHRIQQGDYSLPENVTPLTTQYPNLHRDHGVAVRGGISAFLVVIIATGAWILSGWKAGYMMAEMAAITACILTALDDPIPALKMFIRANIYAIFVIFIYAFGIFPNVTEFWQLALVLAPFIIFCLLLYPHPPLNAIGLPLIMGVIMGLNFHNRYSLDPVTFIDSSLATVIGPIISIWIMRMVRSMSPDMSAQRILSMHYNAIRKALYIAYGPQFRIHLRGMLDRIGVLNTKTVQSEQLKHDINRAIIECSAVVDLTRLQELMQKLNKDDVLLNHLEELSAYLDDYLRAKEFNQNAEVFLDKTVSKIRLLMHEVSNVSDLTVSQRIQISLNNIEKSLCHVTKQDLAA
ncbi:FUSC family protein [Acinetobacter shaoyimingii]|uniref:FUSC family protein n=1 Tax=Acinetobacter shaoyimingii TaxID=2715164 RepID=A0A6G8RWZ9_9GAMM|nr:FUSC family protein [Acinetobacter shaoyimingii]QIO06417.1 FUSC family protein [Acinetobacter shaoyimingii]